MERPMPTTDLHVHRARCLVDIDGGTQGRRDRAKRKAGGPTSDDSD
jgi:hypothetical protein